MPSRLRASRTSGSASSMAKNGSTKIRCRDSGDAIPLPMRVDGEEEERRHEHAGDEDRAAPPRAREQHEPREREQQHDDPRRESSRR